MRGAKFRIQRIRMRIRGISDRILQGTWIRGIRAEYGKNTDTDTYSITKPPIFDNNSHHTPTLTEAQLAASAAAGAPRAKETFANDDAAWNAYQDGWHATFSSGKALPPVGSSERAKAWKAARRQQRQIEEQRARHEAAPPLAYPSGQRTQQQRDNNADY